MGPITALLALAVNFRPFTRAGEFPATAADPVVELTLLEPPTADPAFKVGLANVKSPCCTAKSASSPDMPSLEGSHPVTIKDNKAPIQMTQLNVVLLFNPFIVFSMCHV